MNMSKKFFAVACLLVASQAFGQDENVGRTEAEAEGEAGAYEVGITHFAVRPSAGAIFYNENQRFAGGILMDFNLLSTPWAKFGPAFGALYSSTSTGDFFTGVNAGNNDYIFQLPANMKVTFAPEPSGRLQLGVHGGANIIRTNVVAGGVFGETAPVGVTPGDSSWDARGNVGGDIDYALATGADITLRPDVTFLPDFNMVTATLGLALKL